MGVNFLLRHVYIGDLAKWYKIGTPEEKWLVDDVALVWQRFGFDAEVRVQVSSIQKSKEIKLESIGEAEYEFEAEVKYGAGGDLIVDCGFPFRLCIMSSPIEGKRKLFIFKRKLVIRKGDILKFRGVLEAQTFGEQGVYCHLDGKIVSRKKINEKSDKEFDLIIELDDVRSRWEPKWHHLGKPKELLSKKDFLKIPYS